MRTTSKEINTALAHLGQHPAWGELRKLARDTMEAHFTDLGRSFATKNKQPDYAELQWDRGFFAGMKFLLDNPTIEANKLAAELAKERKERDAE